MRASVTVLVLWSTGFTSCSTATKPQDSDHVKVTPEKGVPIATPLLDAKPAARLGLGPVTNFCALGPLSRSDKSFGNNSLMIYALLDGVYGGKPDQVYLTGSCEYHWGDEENFNAYAYRPKSWSCEFRSYWVAWPPKERGSDIRGNKRLEDWYGTNPQPSIDGTSNHVMAINDFTIAGPGQLTLTCDKPPNEKYLTAENSSCKIAWYNKSVPAEAHFEGKCGATVTPTPDRNGL